MDSILQNWVGKVRFENEQDGSSRDEGSKLCGIDMNMILAESRI